MISDEEDAKPRRIRNPAAKAQVGLQPCCYACKLGWATLLQLKQHVCSVQKAAALGLHGKVAEKVCGRCREMKPAAAYHQNRSKPTGLNSWCRACTNKWYKDRPVQKVTSRLPSSCCSYGQWACSVSMRAVSCRTGVSDMAVPRCCKSAHIAKLSQTSCLLWSQMMVASAIGLMVVVVTAGNSEGEEVQRLPGHQAGGRLP